MIREIFFNIAAGYLIVMSLIGFVAMGVDKSRAMHNKWRISEFTLILIAFLGGGIGSYLGMRWFRHKTKHVKFIILIPIAAFLYAVVAGYLITYFRN